MIGRLLILLAAIGAAHAAPELKVRASTLISEDGRDAALVSSERDVLEQATALCGLRTPVRVGWSQILEDGPFITVQAQFRCDE